MSSTAILNIENDDKFCFRWWILAHIHPSKNSHPNRISNYKKIFNGSNNDGFEFSSRFRCTDVHRFEKLNNLTVNVLELLSSKRSITWKHKLVPLPIKRKPTLLETDNGKELVNEFFNELPKHNDIKRYSRFTAKSNCWPICWNH